jgi:raffinose/stachyose/melibiose transport system permease protein
MSGIAGTQAQVLAVRARRSRDPRRSIFIALMLLPALIALVVYMYYPIVETFRLSFMKSAGLGEATFNGLDNYKFLFGNNEFRQALLHVFQWAVVSVVVQLPLAFFIAFSLIVYKNRITKSLRAIYYLANVMPSAITAMLGIFIFSNTNGVLPTLARKIGFTWLGNIDFLGNQSIAFWAVFIVATWTYTGFPIIYLMARIEQIPTEIKEAAMLDGASGWQYARHIVIPIVSYPLRILAVLMTIGSMKLFELPYLMVRGGPGDATKTLGIILYNQGFVNWQYGSAAAVGVIIFLLSLVFTVSQFTLQSRGGDAE